MKTQIPVACAGHLLANLLYAVPVAVLAIALWIQSMRDKRSDRLEEEQAAEPQIAP